MSRYHNGNYDSDEKPPSEVQLNALVVMQIIKQCEEQRNLGEHAEGFLCGLLDDGRLEITHAFPTLRAEVLGNDDISDYIEDVTSRLRKTNNDYMNVGWYKSAVFGSFLNREVFETQYQYQSGAEESIVLIYDPVRTAQGLLTLKAYRLGPETMRMVKKDGVEFTMDSVRRNNITVECLFQEVPVIIKNSHFTNVMLSELEIIAPSPNKRPFLDLSTGNILEKNMGLLLEGVEQLMSENSKLSNHQKRIQRMEAERRKTVARKNAQRRERGEPPLTEEEIAGMFRPMPESPRADLVLASAQVSQYCEKIGQFSAQSLSKMQLAEALQGKLKDSSAAFLSAIHKEAQT